MHKAFDEMYDGKDRVRAHYREFERWLSELEEQRSAERTGAQRLTSPPPGDS